MRVTMTVIAEIEFVSGKFANRDEIVDEIISDLDGANHGSVFAGEGEYEITEWGAEEVEERKPYGYIIHGNKDAGEGDQFYHATELRKANKDARDNGVSKIAVYS